MLVVEDDPQVADLIHGVLRSAPLRLRTEQASSLLRARRALRTELPQLLVLDMALPDGLGLELLMALRGDERTRRLPVLVQTGVLHTLRRFGRRAEIVAFGVLLARLKGLRPPCALPLGLCGQPRS